MKTALQAPWLVGYTFYTKTVIDAEKIHTIAVTCKKDFKLVKVLGPYIEIIKKMESHFIEDKSNIIRPVSKSHHGRYSASVALKQ
jgi:hypothetical protein